MSAHRLPIVLDERSPLRIAFRLARAAAVVLAACLLPYAVESFRLSQITGALIYAIVIVGLNLLSGFGGQISLGHAAFFGLGAYTTGVTTTKYGMSTVLSFLVGVVVCFVVGALVALPALRLQGIYLALVTLAVGLIFPSLVIRFDSLTGGSSGLFGVGGSPPDIAYFSGQNGETLWHYWVAVMALGLSCLVVWNLMRSRFGRAVIALRDNEAASIVMGVNRTTVRALIFGTSAGIAGLGGGIYAITFGILTPTTFSLLLTLYFLVGMVLGGTGSFWGPILGGIIVYYVPIWAGDLSSSSTSTNLGGIFFGLLIIAITFGLRGGAIGLLRKISDRIVIVRPRRPRRPGPASLAAAAMTSKPSPGGTREASERKVAIGAASVGPTVPSSTERVLPK